MSSSRSKNKTLVKEKPFDSGSLISHEHKTAKNVSLLSNNNSYSSLNSNRNITRYNLKENNVINHYNNSTKNFKNNQNSYFPEGRKTNRKFRSKSREFPEGYFPRTTSNSISKHSDDSPISTSISRNKKYSERSSTSSRSSNISPRSDNNGSSENETPWKRGLRIARDHKLSKNVDHFIPNSNPSSNLKDNNKKYILKENNVIDHETSLPKAFKKNKTLDQKSRGKSRSRSREFPEGYYPRTEIMKSISNSSSRSSSSCSHNEYSNRSLSISSRSSYSSGSYSSTSNYGHTRRLKSTRSYNYNRSRSPVKSNSHLSHNRKSHINQNFISDKEKKSTEMRPLIRYGTESP